MDFKIEAAMAVSAAFPEGIDPQSIRTDKYVWEKEIVWHSPGPAQPITSKFTNMHLYDSGIYDNLGIEPVFDIGTQKFKSKPPIDLFIVSDAGAALRC